MFEKESSFEEEERDVVNFRKKEKKGTDSKSSSRFSSSFMFNRGNKDPASSKESKQGAQTTLFNKMNLKKPNNTSEEGKKNTNQSLSNPLRMSRLQAQAPESAILKISQIKTSANQEMEMAN